MKPTLLLLFVSATALAAGPGKDARSIVEKSGVGGGLIVHLGFQNPERTAGLRMNERFLVHGFSPDAALVEEARQQTSRGVFFYHLSSKRLPYAENMVNLMVVTDGQSSADREEILRVLVPGGSAVFLDTQHAHATAEPHGGDGTRDTLRKSWPAELDQWTHWLHGPDGNAVARDRVAGPPRQMQWIAAPLWSRHHNTVPSVTGQVSANGRVFYIVDDAPASMNDHAPDRWALVARDAFNGLPLWRRPIKEWGWKSWSANWTSRFTVPTHIPKRLVATGNRVYVTLGFNAPLTELDAATGETLRTFAGTEHTDEILHQDGRLVVAINHETQKPGEKDGPPPAAKSVATIDVAGGRVQWKTGPFIGLRSKTGSMERISHLSMVAGSGNVYFVDGQELIALSLEDGKEVWRAPRPEIPEAKMRYSIRISDMCSLVYGDGRLFFAQISPDRRVDWRELRGRLHAFDARTGKELWDHPCASWGWGHPADIFVLDGLVWVADYEGANRTDARVKSGAQLAAKKQWGKKFRSAFYVGLDPATGALKKKTSVYDAFNNGHHHRCYRNKATERWLMTSYRGLEFIAWDGKTAPDLNHWVRGTCRLGAFPCNGLIYANPHPCQCYIGSKLNGFMALAPENPGARSIVPESARLEKGPAYAQTPYLELRPRPSSRAKRSGVEGSRGLETTPEVIATLEIPRLRSASLGMTAGASKSLVGKSRVADSKPSGSSISASQRFSISASQRFSISAFQDWPTFRHDPERSGSTPHPIGANLKKTWETRLGESVSACVIAADTVYASAPDEHCVHAIALADGKPRWRFVAGGRVDTPPTIHGGRVLFGSGDGYVYALRAKDGALIWRLLAAPRERWITAFGDIESAWPVHGSVLVVDDTVYFTAGRSSLLDGGIYAYAADVATGNVLGHKRLQTPHDRPVGISTAWNDNSGRLNDVLVAHGGAVHMRSAKLFDGKATKPRIPAGPLHSTAGLRDSEWFSRVGWYLGERPYGDYLVFDPKSVYGVRARSKQSANGGFFSPGGKGYELFGADLNVRKDRWSARVPVRVKAMVLAGDTLFAAGTPDVIDPVDPWAAYDGKRGGKLLALSSADGTQLASYTLNAAPVSDGMAAAHGRLLVSTADGRVVCYEESEPES